jgi:signal transduction histidine kinase
MNPSAPEINQTRGASQVGDDGTEKRRSPAITNQHIMLTARMFEMRDAAHSLFGQRYAEIIGSWKRVLAHVASERHCNTIEAGLFISRDETRKFELQDVDILAMIAACVDLSEEAQ